MATTHIIIVNYNAGDWLARSLISALRFSDADISVVDNASTDASVSLAQEKVSERSDGARVNWLLNQTNLGFAAANNQVLSDLSAAYAVLLNPDCELQEDTLTAIIDVMQSDPSIGLASCRILNEDGSLQTTCRRRFPTPWSALVRMLQLHRVLPNMPAFDDFDYGRKIRSSDPVEMVDAVSGAFMLARKTAMAEVGLLDERYFMHCEDLDWCKRFALADWKVAFIPRAHVVHAKGVSSKSRPVRVLLSLHKGMNRFFDTFYKTQYAWPTRYLVKLGIVLSFFARAALALVRR